MDLAQTIQTVELAGSIPIYGRYKILSNMGGHDEKSTCKLIMVCLFYYVKCFRK